MQWALCKQQVKQRRNTICMKILFQSLTVTVTHLNCICFRKSAAAGFFCVNTGGDHRSLYLGREANLQKTNSETKSFRKTSIGELCYTDTAYTAADWRQAPLPPRCLFTPCHILKCVCVGSDCPWEAADCDWHSTREWHTNGVIRSLVYISGTLSNPNLLGASLMTRN